MAATSQYKRGHLAYKQVVSFSFPVGKSQVREQVCHCTLTPGSLGTFSAPKGWALPGPLPCPPVSRHAGQATDRAALLASEEMVGATAAVPLKRQDDFT